MRVLFGRRESAGGIVLVPLRISDLLFPGNLKVEPVCCLVNGVAVWGHGFQDHEFPFIPGIVIQRANRVRTIPIILHDLAVFVAV